MIKPKTPNASANLPALELQFGQSANTIYEALLDLNTPADKLYAQWQEIIALRGRILGMYGVDQPAMPQEAKPVPAGGPMQPGMVGGTGGGWSPQAAAMMFDWQSFDWKSKLNQAACTRAKRSMQKGELVYTVEDGPSGGYVCTLTSTGMLQGEYHSESPAASKRLAEHAAAKEAIQAEFPEMYQSIVGPSWAAGGPSNGMAVPAAAKGQKRKMSMMADPWGEQSEAKDGKSKLVHATQLLLGRPVQKGDIVYETVAPEEGAVNSGFSSKVMIPGHDPAASYEGQPGESKKAAESSAAEAALAALQETVAALEEERRQKKAAEAKRKREEKKLSTGGAKPADAAAAAAQAVSPGGFTALPAGPVKAASG